MQDHKKTEHQHHRDEADDEDATELEWILFHRNATIPRYRHHRRALHRKARFSTV